MCECLEFRDELGKFAIDILVAGKKRVYARSDVGLFFLVIMEKGQKSSVV